MFVCRSCTSRLLQSSAELKPSLEGRRLFSTISRSKSADNSVYVPLVQRRSRQYVRASPLQLKKCPYSTSTTTARRPFRLAIIGSGPAGFYTASRVLKLHDEAKIDMYERLPVPFGLVRYGVAPDHPEVKNCQDRFEEIASAPGFSFIGNVDVGGQIPLKILKRHYDAILFTYGASEDRELGIPGEKLKGVCSARNFVAWYNGLPGYSEQDFDLANASNVAIIGQGNVSLDVARILLTSVNDLRKTDVPEHVLEALSRSNVKNVVAIGRRGPLQVCRIVLCNTASCDTDVLQAAFTIKEIRELTAIPGVGFGQVDPAFFPSDLKSLPRARKRIAELLLKASKSSSIASTDKSFKLDFMWSPAEFKASSQSSRSLHELVLQHQTFGDGADTFDPRSTVQSIENDFKTMPTTLGFRSVGYKSTPLPGLPDLGIQFDTRRGVIPNEGGRVVRLPLSQPGVDIPQSLPGLYVAGWVKRGPTGVIASTMEDAFATADCIAQDIDAAKPFLNGPLSSDGAKDGWSGVENELQAHGTAVRRTDWNDWRRIDQVEREHGAKLGKEREKITGVEDMLKVIDG